MAIRGIDLFLERSGTEPLMLISVDNYVPMALYPGTIGDDRMNKLLRRAREIDITEYTMSFTVHRALGEYPFKGGNLKSLGLLCNSLHRAAPGKGLLAKFPGLQSLVLKSASVSEVSQQLKGLLHLTLSSITDIYFHDLMAICSGCPNLQSLALLAPDLSHNMALQDEQHFQASILCFSCLAELRMAWMSAGTMYCILSRILIPANCHLSLTIATTIGERTADLFQMAPPGFFANKTAFTDACHITLDFTLSSKYGPFGVALRAGYTADDVQSARWTGDCLSYCSRLAPEIRLLVSQMGTMLPIHNLRSLHVIVYVDDEDNNDLYWRESLSDATGSEWKQMFERLNHLREFTLQVFGTLLPHRNPLMGLLGPAELGSTNDLILPCLERIHILNTEICQLDICVVERVLRSRLDTAGGRLKRLRFKGDSPWFLSAIGQAGREQQRDDVFAGCRLMTDKLILETDIEDGI
jgi:hypothetical protein